MPQNLLRRHWSVDRATSLGRVKVPGFGGAFFACVVALTIAVGGHCFAMPGSAGALPSTGGAAGLSTGCLRDCFDAAGRNLGPLASLCLVGTAAGCAIPCMSSVDATCLNCVSAAGTGCGLTIGGSLGVCVAQCVNPNSEPPTPTASPTATPVRTACSGDCNGDGRVGIDELVRGVGILLRSQAATECHAADVDGSGVVTVNELVAAVNAALGGCAAAQAVAAAD